MYKDLLQGYPLHPSLLGSPPCPPRLTRDDGVADASGTSLVLVDGRYHPHSGTLGREKGQGTGVTALLGLPQWPVPIAVGQVLRDNLSEDMAGHGKVPSSALGAVQAHHSSLWCKLQNSAHPRQDVAGNAEGMTRRTCPLSKAPSRMSFTVQRVCTRASLRSDWREPHHTRSLCCSSPAHGSSI